MLYYTLSCIKIFCVVTLNSNKQLLRGETRGERKIMFNKKQIKTKLTMVPVNQMYTPYMPNSISGYGRPVSNTLVKKIIDEFDENMVGVVTVYDMDGKEEAPLPYEINDGNHRVSAIRKVFGEDTKLGVLVKPYEERKRRAQTYLDLNQNKRKVDAVEIFRAALVAEKSFETELWNVLQRRGVDIQQLSGNTWPYIRGLDDVKTIYKHDPRPNGLLDLTLYVLKIAYKTSDAKKREVAFQRGCLRMVSGFLNHVKQKTDLERLIKIVGSLPAWEWKHRYHSAESLLPEQHKGSFKYAGYLVLAKEYNKGLRKNKRV